MRLKAFGIGAAAVLAAGTVTFATGAQHVLADCASGTAPTGPYVGSQIGAQGATAVGVGSSFGCIEAGASTSNGVIYNPTTGQAQSAPVGVYVIAQGSQNAPVAQGQGYVGVSNYENPGQPAVADANDSPCDSTNNGGAPVPGDSNSGGFIGVGEGGGLLGPGSCTLGLEDGETGQVVTPAGPLPIFLVAPVACGHVSGNSWGNTDRDGCEEP